MDRGVENCKANIQSMESNDPDSKRDNEIMFGEKWLYNRLQLLLPDPAAAAATTTTTTTTTTAKTAVTTVTTYFWKRLILFVVFVQKGGD